MAKHQCRNNVDAITYYWRFIGIETPRWLDLHPVVNNWRGPRWLVVGAYHFWRLTVRSRFDAGDAQ